MPSSLSPQWVGGGLVPAGALKVAHNNWKSWETETRHQVGNKIALSGLNTRAKISPYLRKQAGGLGMGSVHLPGTSVSIHGRNNPLAGKVKALYQIVIGKGDDRDRKRAQKTFDLWVQNVLVPLIGESTENTPEWERGSKEQRLVKKLADTVLSRSSEGQNFKWKTSYGFPSYKSGGFFYFSLFGFLLR